MHFDLNGIRYRIRFQRGDTIVHPVEELHHQMVRYTDCFIEAGIPVAPETGPPFTWLVVSKARAFLSPKDNFCKEIGRRVSLGRALKGSASAFREAAQRAYENR